MKITIFIFFLINLINICSSLYDYDSIQCSLARKLDESGLDIDEIGACN